MSSIPRVLLLGGHGKISQHFTKTVLAQSWQVTSLIRDPAQKATIAALGQYQPGRLEILVSNLEEVENKVQAQEIITSAAPDYVVWSAGAGGKGGPERTDAVDRRACIAFIEAAEASKSVKKFLLVSYIGSRRHRAPWWSDEDWQAVQGVNQGALKNYYPAKLASDEYLAAASKRRGKDFVAICLRPGTLSDDEAGALISLGKTAATGKVCRNDVAKTASELLEHQDKSCWLDLLQGEEAISKAVERCVQENVDCMEGEETAPPAS